MKRIVKEAVIERKLTDEEKDIIRPHLECNYKIIYFFIQTSIITIIFTSS